MFILRLAIAFIPACMPPLRQCPATHWYRRVPWNITVPTPGHIFALNCLLHVPTLVSLLETDLYQETAITSLLKTHPTVSLTLCSPRSMLFRVQQTQQREMLASVTRIGLHHLAALLSIRFDYRGNAEDLDQATPLVLQRHAHHGPYSHSCEKYYKCIALLGIWLEMEIGITGCEQDGVDNASLYTQPEDILTPLDEITPHILRFWKARLTDKAIVQELRKVIDTDRYGIGITKLKEIQSDMGLKHARQQGHSVETIHDAMVDLRQIYPHAGSRKMISLLFHEREMAVPRSVMKSYFATYEPDLVCQCKARHLCRKRFWAAGVNDLFTVDQHDKWLRFGLALHTGIEPFSGHIMWMRIWHSNKNPQLILSYYLDTLTELGHMPLVTQSDLGTENFGIANAHTLLRQWHDPALQGTLQHRWMRTKKNVVPEITWSQLRHRFTPGFENLLDTGNQNFTLKFQYSKNYFLWTLPGQMKVHPYFATR
ncbi:hypothetical protein EV702DRAFT_1245552 [Suillus placidus]|uniref:Integrase core domain-containing protein n=1 Tax=Suillus placidus TaxID=48579 RepID=A0A9P6ZPQ8_9AGAM|nr:hypothetical protein EV702DRAFT_1245552 [Suillus placidus]